MKWNGGCLYGHRLDRAKQDGHQRGAGGARKAYPPYGRYVGNEEGDGAVIERKRRGADGERLEVRMFLFFVTAGGFLC